jgi:hypothetical protein
MVDTLLDSYIFNFIYVFIKAIFFAVACFLTWRMFDWLEKLDIRAEIAERNNIGLAIMIAAIFLGLAYVIGNL